MTERLDKGLLDFGLIIGEVDRQKYEFITFPVQDSWGVLMRKDDPLAQLEYIRLDDLKSTPMLYSRHSIVKDVLTHSLDRELNEPNLVGSFDLIRNASVFVEHGIGCVLTFDKLITITDDSPLTFRPLKPDLHTPLHLAWKKHQIFSRAAQVYLEMVHKVIDEYISEIP